MTGNRIPNGTFTEVWIDGLLVAGLTGSTVKIEKQKSDVAMCGEMAIDSKTTGVKGKLTLNVHHVFTMLPEDAQQIMQGIDKRHTIVGKLADPDAYGAERVAFYNVSFDDHTFFDAQANRPCTGSHPGTFTGFEYLDKIA
jgi:hypothetical protein